MGSDWWCTAIALHDEDDVLLGAVHHAASLRDVGGRAATCRAPVTARRSRRSPTRPLASARCATTYLHPPFYGSEVGEAFARALGQVGTLRMFGSGTMDTMAIASGQWDVLFQHSVADWDRLPGAAIIRGAGGESVVVPAAGVDWTVAGAPAAVADVRAALVAEEPAPYGHRAGSLRPCSIGSSSSGRASCSRPSSTSSSAWASAPTW